MNQSEAALHMEAIASCPLFCGMRQAELMELLSHPGCSLLEYPAGSTLPSDGMLILLSGRVLIQKPASDGRSILMREALPPQAINAASALSHDGSMSNLTSPDGCRAVHMAGEAISAAIVRGGRFALNMAEFLVGRIVFLNKRIASLGGYTAFSRLTMYLEENAIEDENGLRSLVLPCSLTDLAGYLGVGRASLYRTLDAMEANGTISRRGRSITIHSDF